MIIVLLLSGLPAITLKGLGGAMCRDQRGVCHATSIDPRQRTVVDSCQLLISDITSARLAGFVLNRPRTALVMV